MTLDERPTLDDLETERMARRKDVCTEIKYISVDDLNPDKYRFGIELTEKAIKWVFHSDYYELHDEAFKAAPDDYECVEPIALYHEVLWPVGLNPKGVRDELHHALEVEEYDMLKPGKAHKDWKKGTPVSLCVDIRKSEGARNGIPLTSSGPPSAARPAVPE